MKTPVGSGNSGKRTVSSPQSRRDRMTASGKLMRRVVALVLLVAFTHQVKLALAQEGKIVPYVPTPQEVVDRMLELADIKKGDVVYDLGCGDGRIVVTAAKKYGVKAIGIDIDPARVKDSEENVKKAHVENLVKIMCEDIFVLDLSGASVVTLYLLPELNEKLMPQLAKLKPGSRILSHDFPMDGAKPKKVEKMKVKDEGGIEHDHTIYLWTVPWEKEK